MSVEVVGVVVGIVTLLITGGGMVAAGVWAVGKITASLESHGARIEGLSDQVRGLSEAVTKLDDKHDGLDVRVAKIEAKIDHAA